MKRERRDIYDGLMERVEKDSSGDGTVWTGGERISLEDVPVGVLASSPRSKLEKFISTLKVSLQFLIHQFWPMNTVAAQFCL